MAVSRATTTLHMVVVMMMVMMMMVAPRVGEEGAVEALSGGGGGDLHLGWGSPYCSSPHPTTHRNPPTSGMVVTATTRQPETRIREPHSMKGRQNPGEGGHGWVLWGPGVCHMGAMGGPWVCPIGVPYGCALWVGPMGGPWVCPMGVPYGCAPPPSTPA